MHTPAMKLRRKGWGARWRPKSKTFWQKKVAHTDDKTFAYQTSQEARRKARSMRKTHMYRSGDEGLYFAVPDKLKHRQGNTAVHVTAVIANGRVRKFEYYDGNMNGALYAHICDTVLAPVLGELSDELGGEVPYLLRDCAPQRGTKALSGEGRLAEQRAGIKPIEQAGDSPDTQVCDYWFWHDLNERMARQEEAWEEQHPGEEFNETLPQFKTRLRRTALRTSKRSIDKATGSMKRRCVELAEGDGGWLTGD